ncbi:MAG: DUF1272 domain-containing protein [Maricaulaceae bacterium]
MLEMRPNCEICDKDLGPSAKDARICSFECTFCEDCVNDICPNCGGDLTTRPTRTAKHLAKHPASTKRVLKAR